MHDHRQKTSLRTRTMVLEYCDFWREVIYIYSICCGRAFFCTPFSCNAATVPRQFVGKTMKLTSLATLCGAVALSVTGTVGEPSLDPSVLPYTCSPGSNESSLPFCNPSLGFAARAKDLASRLTLDDHINLFFSYPGTPLIPEYNVKGWSLDHTCIHGLNHESGITVFAHAIAQGASWDVDLLRRVSNATAVEARIISAQDYVKTGGSVSGRALSCDGGPLANTAHDPRWGRIAETYGEDPVHVQLCGVTALKGLQNPQPYNVAGAKPGDKLLATRQVTRHYIGYHGATPDIHGTDFNASIRSLYDSYLPTFVCSPVMATY